MGPTWQRWEREETGAGQSLHGFGPVWLKAGHEGKIPFLFPNQFSKYSGVKINLRKYIGTSENYETLHEGKFEYLAQLLYWKL
jgi:hypothetical protein